MTHEEWLESVNWTNWNTRNAWDKATEVERERCREIVISMGGPDVPDLLRQIDSGEE